MIKLPIDEYREEILAWVRRPISSLADRFLVICAETGAGKSTRVPRYLLDAGCSVLVTQPRRIAARMVAERVAEEFGEQLGETIGYRTGQTGDTCDSPATRCLFVTEALAVVRECLGQGNHNVVILDEVHEWGISIEVLLAYLRGQIESGEDVRVVLMSATLDTESLARHLWGCKVLNVPGRTFPIESRRPCADPALTPEYRIARDAADLAAQGRNVLVFQPGKREIEECSQACTKLGVRKVFALHGEMLKEEQRAAVAACKAGRGVVVIATNVAQTSITIDGIDAVVDSGTARVMTVQRGIEVLQLQPVSKADRMQRKGRAGRTRPGISIEHGRSPETDYPVPEIERTALDQTYLRLCDAGFDPTSLNFYHSPKREEWDRVKGFLLSIDLIDEKHQITTMGTKALKMGVEPRLARMVLEGEKRGVLADVILAVALIQNPIGDRRDKDSQGRILWHTFAKGEERSDVLAQITLYRMAENTRDTRSLGLNGKALRDCQGFVKELTQTISRSVPRIKSSGDKDALLKCLLVGAPDRIYNYSPARRSGEWYNPADGRRNGGDDSLVRNQGEWRIGSPVSIQTQRGTYAHILTMMSGIKLEWIEECLPHLIVEQEDRYSSPTYDMNTHQVFISTTRSVGGHGISNGKRQVTDIQKVTRAIVDWLVSYSEVGKLAAQQNAEAEALNKRGGNLPVYDLYEHFTARLNGRQSLQDVDMAGLALPPLDTVAVAECRRLYPDSIELGGSMLYVSYYASEASVQISLEEAGRTARSWPSQLQLPSGKAVLVRIYHAGYEHVSDSDLTVLRQRVSELCEASIVESWKYSNYCTSPAWSDELPPIREFPTGKYNPVTGQEIVCGVVAVPNYYRDGYSLEYLPLHAAGIRFAAVQAEEEQRREQLRLEEESKRIHQSADDLLVQLRATGEENCAWGGRFYSLMSRPYYAAETVEWERKVLAALDEWQREQDLLKEANEQPAADLAWAGDHYRHDFFLDRGAVQGKGAKILNKRFIPGDGQIVSIRATNGGGVRYSAELVLCEGVEALDKCEFANKRQELYVLGVGQPGWKVGYTHKKDGAAEIHTLCTAAGRGILSLWDGAWTFRCEGYDGGETGPSEQETRTAFNLTVAPKPMAVPNGSVTLASLGQKFNRKCW